MTPLAPTPDAPPDGLAALQRAFQAGVLEGRRDAALAAVDEALARWPVARIYVDVLQTTQYEVGRLWEENVITVAQEHMSTAIVQYVIAQCYDRLPRSPIERGPAIVAGIHGELHQVGANMVADLLDADGWDVRFLGGNVAPARILAAAGEHGAVLVGLSTTLLINVPVVERLIGALKAARPAPAVIVGGAAFRLEPDLWRAVGADGFASDLTDAVAVARTFSRPSARP